MFEGLVFLVLRSDICWQGCGLDTASYCGIAATILWFIAGIMSCIAGKPTEEIAEEEEVIEEEEEVVGEDGDEEAIQEESQLESEEDAENSEESIEEEPSIQNETDDNSAGNSGKHEDAENKG